MRLGVVDGTALVVEGVGEIGLEELREAWESTLPALFGASLSGTGA